MNTSISYGIFNDTKKSNDPKIAVCLSPVKIACESAPKVGASESKDSDLPSECELEAPRSVLARESVSAAAEAAVCVVNITNV